MPWRPLALGVGLALAVALPAVLLAQVLDSLAGDGDAPIGVFALVPVVLAGVGLGGWVVGQRVPSRAIASGGATGLAVMALIVALGVARRIVAGDGVAWTGVPTLLALGAALGAGGAALGRRHPARTRR